ncbi:MAG: phosphoribosyltransferase, partial [Acidimicrobiales bacterium]
VILVEDIVDSGLTLKYLRNNLAARNPASLKVCALLAREKLKIDESELDYVGFRISSEFVVGYGLDAAEQFRQLPYICVYDG